MQEEIGVKCPYTQQVMKEPIKIEFVSTIMRKQLYWNLLPEEKLKGMPGKVLVQCLLFSDEINLYVASFSLLCSH